MGAETFLATCVPDRARRRPWRDCISWSPTSPITNAPQNALRESEGRFRHLFEQASDGIVLADMMGHYLDVNHRGCQMVGYSREELLNMRVTDLLAPRTIHASTISRRRCWRDIGIQANGLRRKDGRLISVEVSAKLQPDRRWHAIVRDITVRKRSKPATRKRSAFSHVSRCTPVLVCIAGVDQSYTWLNKSWLDLYRTGFGG